MANALTLGALRAANVARNVEWDSGAEKVSATFRTTELAGEVGEICNVVKKLERERIGIRGSRDTIEHLAEEIADGIITLDLVAMHYGIDAERAVIAKFNRTSDANGLQTKLPVEPASVPDNTVISRVEAWARREMQNASTPADRELMSLVTHRVATAFMPETIGNPKDGADDRIRQAYRLGQEHMRDRAARVNVDRAGREWVRESLWGRIATDLAARISRLAIEDYAP